jgi:hypothetical protein
MKMGTIRSLCPYDEAYAAPDPDNAEWQIDMVVALEVMANFGDEPEGPS